METYYCISFTSSVCVCMCVLIGVTLYLQEAIKMPGVEGFPSSYYSEGFQRYPKIIQAIDFKGC